MATKSKKPETATVPVRMYPSTMEIVNEGRAETRQTQAAYIADAVELYAKTKKSIKKS